MTIHLPAILMFTRGTRFWHTAIELLLITNNPLPYYAAFIPHTPPNG
jgi:hypothetical protein